MNLIQEPTSSQNKMKTLYGWSTPASNYPRKKHGKAEITWGVYQPRVYHAYWTGPLGEPRYNYYEAALPLYITNMEINGKIWMIDDPPHWWGINALAKEYTGHIAIAGLGLGLIVWALMENPNVTKITVVEIQQDVIDLVGPLLPQKKLEIIQGDFWQTKVSAVDGVFFDIFVGRGVELWPKAVIAIRELEQAYPNVLKHILGFPTKWLKAAAQEENE